MLDYTKAAIKKTITDFKKVDYFRNVTTQILYIAYLIYALITHSGVWIANLILLILATVYFALFLTMTLGVDSKMKRKTRKIAAIVFRRSKQLAKLFTLGVMVYGIYATTKHVTPFSIILTAFLIVAWILQIIFEIVFKFFIGRAQFILEGLEADYETLIKPAKTVGNFFKKLSGKEIEPEKEKTKNRLWLDKRVEQDKAQKKQSKAEKKRQKKQVRQDARDTRFFPKNDPMESTKKLGRQEMEVFEPQKSLPLPNEKTPTEKE